MSISVMQMTQMATERNINDSVKLTALINVNAH